MFGSGGSRPPGPDPRDPAGPPGQELQERGRPVGTRRGPRLPVELNGTFRTPTCLPGCDLPPVSCVPEFFADTPVINGMAYPQLTLPAGVHRFRMLNGTQSRVWNLQLYKESVANPGDADTERRRDPTSSRSAPRAASCRSRRSCRRAIQFDRAKYLAHDPTGYSLVLAGAERADVLIDFSELRRIRASSCTTTRRHRSRMATTRSTTTRGTRPQHPDSTHGPNTRTLMRITITDGSGSRTEDDRRRRCCTALDAQLAAERARPAGRGRCHRHGASKHRRLGYTARNKTLNEGRDPYGRLHPDPGHGQPERHGRHGLRDALHWTRCRTTRSTPRAHPRSGTSTTRRATRTPSTSTS